MSEYLILIALADALRRFVPLLSVGMALYLGVEGGARSVYNWVYIITFGVFGMTSYILLNQPGFEWIPVWVTNETWFILTLLVVALLEVLAFIAAIELQELDPPHTWLHRAYRKIRDWLT